MAILSRTRELRAMCVVDAEAALDSRAQERKLEKQSILSY